MGVGPWVGRDRSIGSAWLYVNLRLTTSIYIRFGHCNHVVAIKFGASSRCAIGAGVDWTELVVLPLGRRSVERSVWVDLAIFCW